MSQLVLPESGVAALLLGIAYWKIATELLYPILGKAARHLGVGRAEDLDFTLDTDGATNDALIELVTVDRR